MRVVFREKERIADEEVLIVGEAGEGWRTIEELSAC